MTQDKTAIEQAREIAAISASVKSAHKRIDGIESLAASVHEIAKCNAVMAAGMENLSDKVGKIESKLDDVRMAPGNRWKALTLHVAMVLICIVLGLVFGNII